MVLTDVQNELLSKDIAVDIEIIGTPVGPTENSSFRGVWRLHGYLDGKEYLWASTGVYAGSIGRTDDGRYYAAPDDRFRSMPGFLCVWYR